MKKWLLLVFVLLIGYAVFQLMPTQLVLTGDEADEKQRYMVGDYQIDLKPAPISIGKHEALELKIWRDGILLDTLLTPSNKDWQSGAAIFVSRFWVDSDIHLDLIISLSHDGRNVSVLQSTDGRLSSSSNPFLELVMYLLQR
jgi:hypothetical protein